MSDSEIVARKPFSDRRISLDEVAVASVVRGPGLGGATVRFELRSGAKIDYWWGMTPSGANRLCAFVNDKLQTA